MPVEPSQVVTFQAPLRSLARWKAEARERQLTLSAFIRDCLDEGAVDQPEVPPPPPVKRPIRRPKPQVFDEVRLGEEIMRKLAPPPGECLKRIAPGSFCKSCGRLH